MEDVVSRDVMILASPRLVAGLGCRGCELWGGGCGVSVLRREEPRPKDSRGHVRQAVAYWARPAEICIDNGVLR
jgi:hypothetical protein